MKLHQIFFSLLVILLPVQLARHFWPDFSLVFGIRIDYLSPTLYLTDILVGLVLFFWGLEKLKNKQSLLLRNQNSKLKTTTKNLKSFCFLCSVFCFLLVNVLLAQNQGVALYKFVKIVEFSLLGLYVAKNKFSLSLIHYPLSIAIIYSSLIALAQFIKQGSLNGVFWFLGERTFNASTPGIARAVFEGQLIMRPYATFPHPNVLAGFVLVGLILTLSFVFRRSKPLAISYLLLAICTLVLSFSRAAWLVGSLIGITTILWHLLKRKKKTVNLVYLALVLALVSGSFWLATKLSTDEAISYRVQLNKIALEMVRQKPLIGVGLNNFIPQLPHHWSTPESVRFLQPVHNIFLLISAETGLVGLLIFLWFLILTFKKLSREAGSRSAGLRTNNLLLLLCLNVILALGLLDHYWLTLQQTQLLFTIILGLAWAKD